MIAKEMLLNMKTKEEYERKKHLLKDLKPDKEVVNHLSMLFGKVNNTDEELYKKERKH